MGRSIGHAPRDGKRAEEGVHGAGHGCRGTAGGYLVWSRLLSFPWVIVVGMIAAMVADNTGYWTGRLGRRRLLDRFGRYVLVTPARLRRGGALFFPHRGQAGFFFP